MMVEMPISVTEGPAIFTSHTPRDLFPWGETALPPPPVNSFSFFSTNVSRSELVTIRGCLPLLCLLFLAYFKPCSLQDRMTDEKDENSLLDSLRYYSSIIGVVCMGVHVVVDGPLSMALLTSILYTLTFNYGSSSNYHVPSLRDTWKKFKLKTILNVFGTTQLALLRIALISLQDMEGEKAVTLFLAYVQLLIAFTDNFTVLCRLEQPEPVRPVLRRDYTRYAPAG